MQVLLAAGDPETRRLLEERLLARGHGIHSCVTAKEAHERYLNRAYPLVIFDTRLPDEETVVFCRRMRSLPQGSSSVFLVVTDDPRPETLQALLKSGADDLLVLPATPVCVDLRLQVAERWTRELIQRRRLIGPWESEENFRLLVETMSEGLGVRDGEGRIIYVNNSFCDMMGYSRDEILGRKVTDFVATEDRVRFEEELAKRPRGESSTYELVMTGQGGRKVATIQAGSPLFDADGAFIGSFAVITDITELKQTEKALRLTQFAVERAADGAFWMKGDGQFFYVNEAACRSLRYTREELLQLGVKDIDPDFGQGLPQELLATLRERGSLTFESRHRTKDGRIFPVEINVNYVRLGDDEFYCAFARDLTERKQVEERLIHDAFHDALTGLPNRALLMDRLDRCIQRSKRSRTAFFAVLFLDLDRFKTVNDSLGHLLGDELLVEMGQRLQGILRPADTVARVGGDEFVILLEEIRDLRAAEHVAARIQRELKAPFKLQQHEVFVTASIGIACSNGQYERADELLRDADTAMYRAKARGRACHVVFEAGMHAHALAQLELETDLHRALEREELRIFYQPIVHLNSGTVVAFEALLRWQHPVRKLLSAGEFIPMAEETSLILAIDRWVLREACRQMRAWREEIAAARSLTLYVNLSDKQFFQADLPRQIEEILRENHLDTRHLGLEVTESLLMEGAEANSTVLLQMKSLNLRLSVGDFGGGYSSLSRLQRFPINTLKISRHLVERLKDGSEYSRLLRTLIQLAQTLGMEVVAEGVETKRQAQHLKEFGCPYAQGYYFSAPLDPEEATHYLRDNLTD